MAIEPTQHILFLRDGESAWELHRRLEEGFPVESDRVHYNDINRCTILSTVNRAFQDGVTERFPFLPAILAPGSRGIYDFNLSRAAMHPRVLLIWRKLTGYQRRQRRAEYSVSFYIRSDPPYAAAHLAFFLLSFTYTAIRTYVTSHYDYDVDRQPQLIGLAYHLSCSWSYGIAYYNCIDDTFQNAQTESASYPRYRTPRLSGLSLTTWPSHCEELLEEQQVLALYENASAFVRA